MSLVEPAGVSSLSAHQCLMLPAERQTTGPHQRTSTSCFTLHKKVNHTRRRARTHTHTHPQTQVMCQPGFSVTHTLIMLQSVWPLASHLQKSNQYVNSVISVRSVPTPFTQKSELLLHSSGPHRISGMKYKYSTARRGESNGLSSSYIFSTAIHRTCQVPPPPPPTLTISYENISPTSNVQMLLRRCKPSAVGVGLEPGSALYLSQPSRPP